MLSVYACQVCYCDVTMQEKRKTIDGLKKISENINDQRKTCLVLQRNFAPLIQKNNAVKNLDD